MKDPARLLDSVASESELRLLRAGASEEPNPEAMQRLAAKLGVGSTAFVGAESAARPVHQGVVTKVSTAVGVKVLVTAAVVATASLGALWYSNRRSDEGRVPAISSVPSVAQPLAASQAPQAAPVVPATTPEPAMTPDSAAARALADEIARLDSARKLLASNRAQSALAALRSYEREHPSGALRQEAALLRIEAFHRAGDRARVRTLAARFLAEHPDSPHAPRVRALASGLIGADAR